MSSAVYRVPYRHDRMSVYHAGSREAHHGPYLLPSDPLVAVNRAFGASRFHVEQRAGINSLGGILNQSRAILTEMLPGGMVRPTVYSDHHLDDLLLPPGPGFCSADRASPRRSGPSLTREVPLAPNRDSSLRTLACVRARPEGPFAFPCQGTPSTRRASKSVCRRMMLRGYSLPLQL